MNEKTNITQTQQKILNKGREYFLEFGFSQAPLRKIVKDAGFTLGAFYGYYKTKEDLFYALTDDIAQGFKAIILSVRQEMIKLPKEEQIFSMFDCYLSKLDEIVDYIDQNKTEMTLILKCSDGTKYENFMESFRLTNSQQISKSVENTKINSALIDMLMSGYFDILTRIMVETQDKEQMYNLLRDVAIVYKNGIISLVKEEI